MARDNGMLSDDFLGYSAGDDSFDLSGFSDEAPAPKKKRGRKKSSRRYSEPTFDDGFNFGSSNDEDSFSFDEPEEPEVSRKAKKKKEKKPRVKKPKRVSKRKEVVPEEAPEDDFTFGTDSVDADIPYDDDDDDDDSFVDSDNNKNVGKSVVAPIVSVVFVVILLLAGIFVFAVKSDSDILSNVTASGGGNSSEESLVDSEPTSSSVEEETEEVQIPTASTTERVGVEQTDGTINGVGTEGDQSSGTDVIFSYEYAYYHLRSDDDANALFDGTPVKDIESKVAEGTRYEVRVTPKVIGASYDVVLVLAIDDKVNEYELAVTTAFKDGKYYVTSIKLKD